jgi:hypothetical protein
MLQQLLLPRAYLVGMDAEFFRKLRDRLVTLDRGQGNLELLLLAPTSSSVFTHDSPLSDSISH